MDKKFSKWYRERYEQISSPPPEELWAGIAAALDEKRRRERKRLGAFLFSSAGVLLFTGALLMFAVGNNINKGEPFSAMASHLMAGIADPHASLLTKSESNLSYAVKRKEGPEKSTSSPKRTYKNLNVQAITASSLVRPSSPKHASTSPQLSYVRSYSRLDLSAVFSPLTEELASLEFKGAITSAPLDSAKRMPPSRSYYLGLTGNYHNAWVVNSNLWCAAQRNSLSYVVPYYSASASLLAGFSLGHKKSLFAELGVYRLGQRYYSYQEGYLSQYELTLRYLNLNLYASFNSIHRARKNVESWFALQTGMHTGYLLSASENNDSGAENIREDYRKVNAGLLLGIAYNTLWKKHLGISIGVRGQIGLLNVYSGNDELPLSLNRTFNESASLFTSLYYSF